MERIWLRQSRIWARAMCFLVGDCNFWLISCSVFLFILGVIAADDLSKPEPGSFVKAFFNFFLNSLERRMDAWFEGGANCNEWPGINFFYFFRFCSLTKIFCFVTIRGWSAGCGGSSVYLSTVLIVAIAPHIYFFFLFLFINWEI